jgi:Ca-activated chloride channel homolog
MPRLHRRQEPLLRNLTPKRCLWVCLFASALAFGGAFSRDARGQKPVANQDQSQALFKANVNLVNVIFNVTDKSKHFVTTLTQTDFEIYEDGAKQEILYFTNFNQGGEVPLTVALVVDTSGSVKDKLQLEIDTALEFLRKILRPNKDLALLMQFGSEVELVQDFTDDIRRLEKGLDSLRAGGGTALYDAVFLACNDKLKHEAGRKVIVVLSDGDDNQSKVKKEEAIAAAQKVDVLIYGIGVKSDIFPADFGVLKDFARQTGGRFFVARERFAEIEQAFEGIHRDLQNQYAIAYSSTNSKQDGTFRKIEVRCKNKTNMVKSRSGYYAPKDDITGAP